MWKQSQLFLLCITHYYLISFGVQCTTKYYVTRNELKKRFDDQLIINPGAFKKSASSLKDPIQVSNSNTYLVDSTGYIGGESNELADYGDHEGAFAHKLVAIDRKASKFFGDEVSFVIVVVTLTVFFGILSSLLIPLTLLLINGGFGGLGGFSSLGGLNTIMPVAGLSSPGFIGRRRRRRDIRELTQDYAQLFDSAIAKFKKH